MKRRIALIPSYEPDNNLLDVVTNCLSSGFEVVVVNDGSNPSFDGVFNKLPSDVHYLSYETNQGKGHALKHGFSYIKGNFDSKQYNQYENDAIGNILVRWYCSNTNGEDTGIFNFKYEYFY